MKKTKTIKKADEHQEPMIEGKTRPIGNEEDTGSEKLEEKRDQLPPFPPPPKGKESLFSPMNGEVTEEAADFEAVDIRDFCADMAGAFGEIAHIINPRIRSLDAKEKKLISTPFSRIIIKNGWDKICKDELVLMMVLGHIVYVRIKEMKADSPERKVIQ